MLTAPIKNYTFSLPNGTTGGVFIYPNKKGGVPSEQGGRLKYTPCQPTKAKKRPEILRFQVFFWWR